MCDFGDQLAAIFERLSLESVDHLRRNAVYNDPGIASTSSMRGARDTLNCFEVRSFIEPNGLFKYKLGMNLKNRYQLVRLLHECNHCRLFQAIDKKTGKSVVVRNAIQIGELPLWGLRRECVVLNCLAKRNLRDVAVWILDDFTFASCYFVVYEKYDVNFAVLVKKKLCPNTYRELGKNLFECLDMIHTAGLVHCNISPKKVFLMSVCSPRLKISGFGLSCAFNELMGHSIKPALQYQAPEVVLGGDISPSIDVWSATCLIVELFLGYPIFGGEDEYDLVALMVERMGIPDQKFLNSCNPSMVAKHFNEERFPHYCIRTPMASGRELLTLTVSAAGRSRVCPGQASIKSIICNCHPYLLDFANKVFVWESSKRLTVGEALQHPFLHHY